MSSIKKTFANLKYNSRLASYYNQSTEIYVQVDLISSFSCC